MLIHNVAWRLHPLDGAHVRNGRRRYCGFRLSHHSVSISRILQPSQPVRPASTHPNGTSLSRKALSCKGLNWALAWLEAGLSALGSTRLTKRDKLSAVISLLYSVRGAAALEIQVKAHGKRTEADDHRRCGSQ
jgi:hypothetical protein